MTYVYKTLPDGSYTAVPVRSAVDTARKLREGWSLTCPVTVSAPEAEIKEAYAEPPKKRGRPRAESVN